jgi:arsenite methyltransferase
MTMQRPRLDYDHALSIKQRDVAMTPDMVDQRARVRQALQLRPGESVLEVGCGNGLLAVEMVTEVGSMGRVTGADISPAMVSLANEICKDCGNTRFVAADVVELPFDDASFDVAVAVQCLCFVPEVARATAELYRVLRPGGRVVVLDTDWDTWVWNSTDPTSMAKMMNLYKQVYADARLPRTLSKQLVNAGFDITRRDQFAIENRHLVPDSYSGHQISFVAAVAQDAVSAAEIQAWSDSILAAANSGGYSFSLCRDLFSAVKPATSNAPPIVDLDLDAIDPNS